MTQEDRMAFLTFVPNQIEAGDFDKKWWPALEGFPFNILYSSARQASNGRPAMVSALYTPDLGTCLETETTRELTYFNKSGGDYRVRVVLKQTGSIEAFKYKGEKLIAWTEGHDFDSAMVQTILIGIQKDEPVEVNSY